MQASVTQLILLAVAVAVAAIVTVVVIGVVRSEGDNIDKTRNEAAFEACQLAGGSFFWAASGEIDTSSGALTAATLASGGASAEDARAGECVF